MNSGLNPVDSVKGLSLLHRVMSTADSSSELPAALNGYPAPVTAAYLDYKASGQTAEMERFLLRCLDFFLERSAADSVLDLPPGTRLMEDLGADSLLVAELVFLLEDLFEIQLLNEDLSKISTLSDLHALVQNKIG